MIFYLKSHWQLLAITAVVFAVWQTPVAVPLKIFVVFLHEFSHAAVTLLTGGEVMELHISAREGGHVISRGGSRFLILSAGYLGSLILGVALLVVALRTNADRVAMALCGAVMLLVATLYVRDAFALMFCCVAGAGMLAIARFTHVQVSDLALRVIGLTSILYVPYDIFDDTILRSSQRSDARMLAEEFLLPTVFWGGLWLIISGGVIWWCLRRGIGANSNIVSGPQT